MTEPDQDRAPPEPVAALLDELEDAAAREDRDAVARTLRELADHYGIGVNHGSAVSGP